MADFNSKFTVLNVEEISCEFEVGNPLRDVMVLWKNWSKGNAAPTWQDIELPAIPPVILPQTLVVDVINGGEDYQYRFWGSDYTRNYGIDETGLLLSESLGPGFIEASRNQYALVTKSKKPCCFIATIIAPRSGIVQAKTNLRLPIMDEPDTVTKILTATMFHKATFEQSEKLRKAIGADKQHLIDFHK